MMTSMQTYARRSRHLLQRLVLDPKLHTLARGTLCFLLGLCSGAASLSRHAQPLVLGLVCAARGLPSVLIGAGGALGYWFFWGRAGTQGILWSAMGLVFSLLVGERPIRREAPLLMPSLAAFTTAACGVLFQQLFADDTAVPIYLLRVLLALGSTWVFQSTAQDNDPVARWLSAGLLVLSLSQILPVSWLNLGAVGAGALCVAAPFPAAALGGLGLDLAQVTSIPMTAVLCLAFFLRMLPRLPPWARALGPGGVCIGVMALCGIWDGAMLPGLLLGGGLGLLIPGQQQLSHRRGETGIAQVRLEMAAGVLTQTQELLLETAMPSVDEAAVLSRCAERACGSCPCRKGCKDRDAVLNLPVQLLHRPLLDSHDLPFVCRKSGRLLTELHRCQEQLRAIRADRARLREYRAAVVQQYYFLSSYLRELADQLPQRTRPAEPLFDVKVTVRSRQKESDSGDRCTCFAGIQCRYYVLLCDGMGTGLGAADEGKTALRMLKQMLCAGFPAEHALRSLNSLCALRMKSGIVTFDLLELQLDSGRGTLYKWGAAPSFRVSENGAEKIGTAGPPPGLSITEGRETAERLSLRRGEVLVMVSDGVDEEEALRALLSAPEKTPGELASYILEQGSREGGDDATVVTIRLSPAP